MDPVTSCLLFAFVIMKTVRAIKVDREYAKQGIVPPSYRLAERLLEKRKAAGTAAPDATVKSYGMRGYAGQRWRAMWEDLGEQHLQTRAAQKAERDQALAAGEPAPRKPGLRDGAAAAWRWVITPIGEHQPTPQPVRPIKASPAPASPAPAATAAPQTPPPGPPVDRDPDPQPDPSAAQPSTPTTPATREKEANMATTGEVTGLSSAIAYAEAMANAHRSHAGSEGYVASLANFEVGQGDIEKVQSAMEASNNAASMWAAAAASIKESNNATKEAYMTSPNAGNKQFATQE